MDSDRLYLASSTIVLCRLYAVYSKPQSMDAEHRRQEALGF